MDQKEGMMTNPLSSSFIPMSTTVIYRISATVPCLIPHPEEPVYPSLSLLLFPLNPCPDPFRVSARKPPTSLIVCPRVCARGRRILISRALLKKQTGDVSRDPHHGDLARVCGEA